MLKGHTTIELKNVETGEIERYEDDNLITHAIAYIIDIELANNHNPNDYCLPVATKLLGGLMMFDSALEESADNIHFPTDVHLVGFAGQTTEVTHPMGGTYNTTESGYTEDGFKSVWDFGTGQANGTIAALARTHAYGGENPLRRFHGPRFDTYAFKGEPDNDRSWTPLRYDGEYMYMLKANTSTHLMRLARVKMPIHSMGVGEYNRRNYPYEVIASWDTFMREAPNTGLPVFYMDDTNYYMDGGDGYIYVFIGEWEHIDTNKHKIYYFTIKYSDESYDKSAIHSITLPFTPLSERGGGYYSAYGYAYYRLFPRSRIHIVNSTLYFIAENRKGLYIVPFNNPSAARLTSIIPNDSSDYIDWFMRIPLHNGGVHFRLYHYLTNGAQWEDGILYPDGVYILPDVAAGSDDFYWDYWQHNGDKLEQLANPYGNSTEVLYARSGWSAIYLGTINNLATPITKTAAQTMRVIYTLTDVDE